MARQRFSGMMETLGRRMQMCSGRVGIFVPIIILSIALVGCMMQLSAAANAHVGRKLGLMRATLIFLTVGALLVPPLAYVIEGGLNITALAEVPLYLFIPGVLNAFMIMVVVHTIDLIGVTFMGAATFTGQMVMSLLLDHIGFLGLREIPISAMRVLAVAILLVGMGRLSIVDLLQSSRRPGTRASFAHHSAEPKAGFPGVRWDGILVALLMGTAMNVVAGLNSALGQEVGVMTATWLFLTPGAVLLFLYSLIRKKLPRGGVRWMHLVPGALNVIGVASMVFFVAIAGLRVSIGTQVGAGVIAALFIDKYGLWGLSRREISPHRIQGVMVILLGGILSAMTG